MGEFQLRTGSDEDLAIVHSAAAKSLRSSPLYRDVPPDQYTEVMNGLVTRMTAAPWQLTIAHPTGYPSEVAGFVLHRTGHTHRGQPIPVVGFLYTKEPYRRQGVARQLLQHATNGCPDFLAVLAQPRVLSMCRDRGLKPQLSPYLL